jgi:Gpi18-like mannosyltransferase
MPLEEIEKRGRLASWLRSPWFAVATAFVLRMMILRIYHHYHDAGIVRLPTIGTESGKVAWSIATGKGFSGLWYGLDGPTAWISPVYPYLLAAVYKLAHMDNSAARVGAQIMNCAFASLTCWPIYAVGRKIFSVRTGLLAAWAWVFLPTAIQIPMEWIWDQSLDALLVTLLLWATLELRENSSTVHWSAYGLFWAFAVLTNPGLGVMLPFFLFGLILWLPFQALVLLLQHPGEMVSREELSKQLWPEGTFVDFERGLNKAINKLRAALRAEPGAIEAREIQMIKDLTRNNSVREVAP